MKDNTTCYRYIDDETSNHIIKMVIKNGEYYELTITQKNSPAMSARVFRIIRLGDKKEFKKLVKIINQLNSIL